MSKKIVFRQIKRGEMPLLTALFNSLFLVQKPESFFLWQSFEYIFQAFIMGAFHGDELIGTFGIQTRPMGKGLVCGLAHWPAVSQAWQGKSIFSELTKRVMEQFTELDLLFTFSPERARRQVSKSLGMKMIDTPEMVLSSPGQFDNHGIKVSLIDTNTVFRRIEPRKEGVFMFDYTPEYRSWRYSKNPVYTYEMVEIDTGEYAIIKNFIDPVTKDTYGDIVDIECDHSDQEKIKKLILGACWRLRAQGMANLTTWAMPDTKLREVVEEIGFSEGERGKYYFGLKVLNNQHDYLYDFSKWRLQQCEYQKY